MKEKDLHFCNYSCQYKIVASAVLPSRDLLFEEVLRALGQPAPAAPAAAPSPPLREVIEVDSEEEEEMEVEVPHAPTAPILGSLFFEMPATEEEFLEWLRGIELWRLPGLLLKGNALTDRSLGALSMNLASNADRITKLYIEDGVFTEQGFETIVHIACRMPQLEELIVSTQEKLAPKAVHNLLQQFSRLLLINNQQLKKISFAMNCTEREWVGRQETRKQLQGYLPGVNIELIPLKGDA